MFETKAGRYFPPASIAAAAIRKRWAHFGGIIRHGVLAGDDWRRMAQMTAYRLARFINA